jgi:2'-5' RNA ligase
MKIQKFDEFSNELNEKKKDTYSYGCAMIYFDAPEIFKVQDAIDPKDLYEEEGDRTYGFEDEPHTTLLYGLHTDEIENDQDVMNVCVSIEVGPIKLHNISLFKNEKYEVLKFDAENENLHKINKALTDKFPFSTDFPDYHPHATVAYLKPGTGDEYVKSFKDIEVEAIPESIVYSKPDGEKVIEKVEKKED